ncbi:alpha/beta fold hydrolase [Halopseudomonas formosensis]|uniref:Alpha/beta hydrolase n=1 Tax=Halopseudomonas formosensis TaxID=1002526 RepID=A0ABU5C022_9GAMM|nr:alpha/beta hydrolase [Halopseudomonas formosensis]MDX9687691.1 alpha/beta hydrolase [Halopseudomonas formosensis]
MPEVRSGQPESRYFHSRGLRLHYLDWGNIGAPVLILLHGGLEHARVWDQLARQLCSDWHVVVPDLRGHGDSEWSGGGAYSIVDMVPDLAALLAELGEPVIHLVGHSLGGNVAIHYTALFPQQVARLCVIEGLGFSPEARARRDRRSRLEQLRQWVEKAREVDLRRPRGYASIAEAVARLREHDPLLSPELASQVCEHGMRINERGLWQWKYDPRVRASGPSEVASPEPSDLWRAIECPVLLMYGEQSWASNPEKDGRLRHFARARLVTVAQAGHNLHHHQPEVFLAHLQRFLAQARDQE